MIKHIIVVSFLLIFLSNSAVAYFAEASSTEYSNKLLKRQDGLEIKCTDSTNTSQDISSLPPATPTATTTATTTTTTSSLTAPGNIYTQTTTTSSLAVISPTNNSLAATCSITTLTVTATSIVTSSPHPTTATITTTITITTTTSPSTSSPTTPHGAVPTPLHTVTDAQKRTYTLWAAYPCLVDTNHTLLRGPSNGYAYRANRTAYGCAEDCSTQKYPLFGLRDGECICGSQELALVVPTDNDNCNTHCPDDPTTACGGPGFMAFYYATFTDYSTVFMPKPTGISDEWIFQGCYAGNKYVPGGIPNIAAGSMSVNECTKQCQAMNLKTAWLTNGNQCRCGTDQPPDSALLDYYDCYIACPSGEICGGKEGQYVIYKQCPGSDKSACKAPFS